ncbi:GGDEF domain-containing protein [Pseudomonas sp. 10-1B]|uniref:GGDEF domain-containing protein n=1 Tax=Pseudomonas sp. 10-1B TaxID=1546029 RepID=UPI000685AB07|nr:GGDEF domain-containing protein [Pseudomonas sp. 10-1B]
MLLSIPTLLLVTDFLLALMGGLTLHAWSRGAHEPPLAYLASMLFMASLGFALVSYRGWGFDFVPLVMGNMILLTSAAMSWTAMRAFAGRPPHWPGIVLGAGLWFIFGLTPGFDDSLSTRVAIYSILSAGYGGLAAFELWRSRTRLQVSYLPALLLLTMHAGFYIVRAFVDDGESLANALSKREAENHFFSFMLFESMIYAIGIAYITLAMVREQAELKFKAAAYTDMLTGVGNRRAFMLESEAALAEARVRQNPMALLIFDLDNFKRLNDTLGHQAGDQALVSFSQVVKANVRLSDVFGRIGGEEFACLLLNANEQDAELVAKNICLQFHHLALPLPKSQSVSIGVATHEVGGYTLSRLLSLADEALYDAKKDGRNRVRIYSSASSSAAPATIIDYE